MARDGSRCSRKPRVPVSSAAKRIYRHSPLSHAVAEAQKMPVLITDRSIAPFTLTHQRSQEGPLATAVSNRELLVLEHASTH